ncbi:MAG: septum site-determining protein MinC [Anaerolineales bacterium]|nr:septum site-determining protein MinC [Anaerolineales bacterium]MCB0029901.1 septum site-determining protein MinC [Anaerolineales bacterium]MCB8960401.1 septum site-determining protein MinC [Ardenticatenales bacterium]
MTQVADLQIKGVRDGLLVSVKHLAPDELAIELPQALAERGDFLRGSRLALDVGNRRLNKAQMLATQRALAELDIELWAILTTDGLTRETARQAGLATRLPGTATDLEGNLLPELTLAAEDQAQTIPQDFPSNGLILTETLRSGRSIQHEGHVVVIGDVNKGAEIIATGNVLVWGRLLGLVHAGVAGDESATVCALGLAPTQLRIADKITISPPGAARRLEPEIASIQNGQIVAELWRG